MADYEKIEIPEKIRHQRDFEDFIANFNRQWNAIIKSIALIKQELERLQQEKQDA